MCQLFPISLHEGNDHIRTEPVTAIDIQKDCPQHYQFNNQFNKIIFIMNLSKKITNRSVNQGTTCSKKRNKAENF